MGNDFWLVVQWWSVLFAVGAAAYPLTRKLFGTWFDKGYYFSKAIGLAVTTWIVYAAGTAKLAPFSLLLIITAIGIVFVAGLYLLKQDFDSSSHASPSLGERGISALRRDWIRVTAQEAAFFLLLFLWSWVKAHEPSIRGLEKFMDYGFAQSVLTDRTFPVWDFWYAGSTINYYYFGHITMALLTELTGIPLSYTFNLMLATLFALCATMSYAIGHQITISNIKYQISNIKTTTKWAIAAGLLTAFLVTLAGNMQTIYAFTKGYTGENVAPFWDLAWAPAEFIPRLSEGIQRYWYANATRFIPFTIHEFPSYSFVVSDVHGHVLSIPFALLAIAAIINIFAMDQSHAPVHIRTPKHHKPVSAYMLMQQYVEKPLWYGFYGFLVAVLLMTNALDGPIYAGLFATALLVRSVRQHGVGRTALLRWIAGCLMMAAMLILASLPFTLFFKSFVSGIAINCPPPFLANRIFGPLIFEGVEKCQKSPLWMWWLLWGFFVYTGLRLVLSRVQINMEKRISWLKVIVLKTETTHAHIVLMVLFFYSLVLLIVPEFIYFKDIYPAHFRSNTMFKLGYQAFMMLSIVSGFVIIQTLHEQRWSWKTRLFLLVLLPQLFLISFYPLRSIPSYFGDLRTYRGLYGLSWVDTEYPDYAAVIRWIKQEVACDPGRKGCRVPVLVEADGDSYTDYNQVSAFTGVPSVVGWAVHQWLWRGSYDVVAPRREDVRKIYESTDGKEVETILNKYSVQYILMGKLEREKYKALNEPLIRSLTSEAFRSGDTVLYRVKSQ